MRTALLLVLVTKGAEYEVASRKVPGGRQAGTVRNLVCEAIVEPLEANIARCLDGLRAGAAA
jgi:hypothetical protein